MILPENIRSTCKTFVDDTSLFSPVLDKGTSQDELNYDLQMVSNWAFSRKLNSTLPPPPKKKKSTKSDFLLKTLE